MSKPFKGHIRDWKRVNFDSNKFSFNSLGFVIQGTCKDHPSLRGDWMQTSAIVQYFEIPRHKGEERKIAVETLNSEYILVGEGVGL